MSNGRLIIGLCYPQQQDALTSATETMVQDFCSLGYEALAIDVGGAAGLAQLAGHLHAGAVDFCFGVQGVGSNLKVGDESLWSLHRTPFVGLHFDHPCHNPLNHVNQSPHVGNLYYFESFCAARQRYLGGPQLCGSIRPDFFRCSVTPELIESERVFATRPIRYLYVKSGVDVQRVTDDVNSIHISVRDAVWQQIEQARRFPDVELCDLVAEIFRGAGYDRAVYERQFWGITQIMDQYIRAKRSVDFVNWLKMQEGAVIIGDGWDSIDRTGARAVFRPTMPIEDAYACFSQTRLICNTNPHGADVIHERVVKGLLQGCVVLTDTNRWWDGHYSDVTALRRFDWSDGWQERVSAMVEQVAYTPETCWQAIERAMADFTHRESYGNIASFAQQIRHKAAAA